MISIIIPVYNAEGYLRACLDSVLGQTTGDLEIICIDDGSTDGSPAILARYAAGDGRVRVITQSNGGISAARNRGLDEARGEWLLFVDADDWIDAETCETALNAAAGHNVDVVFWSYLREFDGGKRSPRPLMHGDALFEGESLRLLHRKIVGPVDAELGDPTLLHSWGTVWGKLYRREAVVGGTRFTNTQTIGSAEDVLFNVEVFTRVGKAVYIDRPMYHYRKHNVSFTGGYNDKLNERWERLYDMMRGTLDGFGAASDFHTALDNRIALGLIGQGLNECRSGADAAAKIGSIKKIISTPRYRHAVRSMPLGFFPPHWRLFFHAARNGNAVLLYLLLLVMARVR